MLKFFFNPDGNTNKNVYDPALHNEPDVGGYVPPTYVPPTLVISPIMAQPATTESTATVELNGSQAPAASPALTAPETLAQLTAPTTTISQNEFFIALKEEQLAIVQRYITDNPLLIDSRNADGFTALMVAADHGHVEIVRYLISKGANADLTVNFHGVLKTARELIEASVNRAEVMEELDSYITIDQVLHRITERSEIKPITIDAEILKTQCGF